MCIPAPISGRFPDLFIHIQSCLPKCYHSVTISKSFALPTYSDEFVPDLHRFPFYPLKTDVYAFICNVYRQKTTVFIGTRYSIRFRVIIAYIFLFCNSNYCNQRQRVFRRVSTSKGFPICSFIPASFAACTSSANTSAVMAIIGILKASSFAVARSLLVVS